MIRLDIAEYCQDCPDFEVVDEIQERFEDGCLKHSIRCKYEERCTSIYRFLKQNLIKNKQ